MNRDDDPREETTGRPDATIALDRVLRAVPRELSPTRDLWPGIEAELRAARPPAAASAPAPRARWHYALAASLVLGVGAAFVGLQTGREAAVPVAATSGGQPVDGADGAAPARGARDLEQDPVLAGAPREPGLPLLAAAAFDVPGDANYRTTRAALEATFRERLLLLAPETRARIEENLAIIHRAHEDIRAALADDPASPVLQRLLESTWRQELELYATVNRTTEPALPRTRT